MITCIGKFIFCFPPEIPRDIAFIPSILKRVQRWRVSWRSIGFWSRLISMSVRCILKVSSFIHSAQSHIKTRHCSAISCTVYRTARPKRRLQGLCRRKLLPYHCLLFAVVCPTKQNRCGEVKWAGKNCTSQKELWFSCQHSNRGGQFGLVHFSDMPDVFFSQFSMIFLIPFTTGFSHSTCNWRPEVKMFCSCAIIERAFLDLDKCRWRKINVVPCLNYSRSTERWA